MNFRQVSKKIKSVSNVKKITNAMQMVSAVKMRKAQNAAVQGRLYRQTLDRILQRVISTSSEISTFNIPWLQETAGEKHLYILVTSNKGLCGSFHTNLFKHLLVNMDKNSEFITIGGKGAEFITRTGSKIAADFSDSMPFVDSVSAVSSLMADKFLSGEYKNVSIVFNMFVTTATSKPTIDQLLPVASIDELEKDDEDDAAYFADYLIEPSPQELLKPLIEDYVREKIRSAIIDSEASEHSARMMAMKSATENAGDLIFSLTLLRNKLRQGQITNELLDMIAAKESTA